MPNENMPPDPMGAADPLLKQVAPPDNPWIFPANIKFTQPHPIKFFDVAQQAEPIDDGSFDAEEDAIHEDQPTNPDIKYKKAFAAAMEAYSARNTMATNKKQELVDEQAAPTLPWHERLDKYPTDQTGDTKPKDRVCAVAGKPTMAIPSSNWRWYDPYWVCAYSNEEFLAFMDLMHDAKKFGLKSKGGVVFNTSSYYTESYLKKEGYVKLGKLFGRTWWKKNDTFKFATRQPGYAPFIAPNASKHQFPTCFVTGEHWRHNELLNVVMAGGEIVNVSEAGLPKMTQVHRCQTCGGHFQEPQISFFVDYPPLADQYHCVTCQNKAIEKNVIRHYDDSHYLEPIPDIMVTRLKGRERNIKNIRMFGVELEVGFNQGERVKVAMDVWNTVGKDFCYIKHDGSITKTQFDDGYKVKNVMKMGFEIVSAPAGINVHRQRWHALATCASFKLLRSWDADSCGFHVHVSKDALTWLQIGRMLVFVNHPNNKYFINVVAGRGDGHYTRFIKKNLTDCAKVDDSKYMALRTNKPNTIEFRIFRGTINYNHIIRNIEFVDAVCDFCMPCAASLTDMTDFRRFIAFVESRRSIYPELSRWLTTIDLIAKKGLSNPKVRAVSPLEEALSDRVVEQMKAILPIVKSTKSIEKILKEDCPKVAKKKVEVAFEDTADEGHDAF